MPTFELTLQRQQLEVAAACRLLAGAAECLCMYLMPALNRGTVPIVQTVHLSDSIEGAAGSCSCPLLPAPPTPAAKSMQHVLSGAAENYTEGAAEGCWEVRLLVSSLAGPGVDWCAVPSRLSWRLRQPGSLQRAAG